jgi:DNA-binding MarR family transcriptional regulator
VHEERTTVLREGVLLQLFVAGQLAGALLESELGDTMRPDRFAVQSVIGAMGPITPTELARRLGMAPTTISSWLARLERAGSAQRHPNPVDGRSQLIELTPKGRRELNRALPGFRRAIERVLDALDGDVDAVLAGSARLVDALRQALAETANS